MSAAINFETLKRANPVGTDEISFPWLNPPARQRNAQLNKLVPKNAPDYQPAPPKSGIAGLLSGASNAIDSVASQAAAIFGLQKTVGSAQSTNVKVADSSAPSSTPASQSVVSWLNDIANGVQDFFITNFTYKGSVGGVVAGGDVGKAANIVPATPTTQPLVGTQLFQSTGSGLTYKYIGKEGDKIP